MKTVFFINALQEDVQNAGEAAKEIMYFLTQIGVAAKVSPGIHVCIEDNKAVKYFGGMVETDVDYSEAINVMQLLKTKFGNKKIIAAYPGLEKPSNGMTALDKFVVSRCPADMDSICDAWMRRAEKLFATSGIAAECYMQSFSDGGLKITGYENPECDGKKWSFVVCSVATSCGFRTPEYFRDNIFIL